MNRPYILAIDEGTTNAKAIAVDNGGVMIAKGSTTLSMTHPQPGWAEQDPNAIWRATLEAIAHCLHSLDINLLSGIAVSNQRESIMAWDRTSGSPLSPLLSWQCHRSEDLCIKIAKKAGAERIKDITGSVIDPLFPASKIAWLFESDNTLQKRAENGEVCIGTVDTWLVWNLTHGKTFTTDYSNASRYQLFNIRDLVWDNELLALYNIPRCCLPDVISSSVLRGVTNKVDGLPNNIPILSQIGDSHAALYGQGGYQNGVMKASYGTGSSLMTCTDQSPILNSGISTTIAWHDGAVSLALEGNITHTGAAIQYISKLLGIDDIDQLSKLAWSVKNNQGVYFVPALAGLGAPYWNTKARGMICGLTEAATPATLARATFESVVFQVADLFFAMKEVGNIELNALSVDGGPTKSTELMQLQADLLSVPIIRSDIPEVSAMGAAYLAGKALGWWTNHQALSALPTATHTIIPNSDNQQIKQNYKQWKVAVERTRFQTDL